MSQTEFTMTIAGEAVPTGRTFGVSNPATGEVFAEAPGVLPRAARRGVRRGRQGGAATGRRTRRPGGPRCCAAADVLLASPGDLAPILTAEQGKPLADAGIEVFASAIWPQYFADLETPPQVIQDDDSATWSWSAAPARRGGRHHAVELPPDRSPSGRSRPALLAGNTLVLKPSPFTPLSTLALGELLPRRVPARRGQRA